MTDEEIENSIRLLQMQTKMDFNNNPRGYNNPGPQLKAAKRALELANDCRPHLAHVKDSCHRIITLYMISLNQTNKMMLDSDLKRPDSLISHHFFLIQIHRDQPKWSQEYVEGYPYAYVHLDQPWCSWTTLLK
jgi:hypothetical protein